MTHSPFGIEPRIPVLSRRTEWALAVCAAAVMLGGGLWLFTDSPMPIESKQENLALMAPGDTSPMPKLDHDDPANPTVAFMTADALAHVASLKLAPEMPSAAPALKTRIVTAKVHAVQRQAIVHALYMPLPPRRPADLSSNLIQANAAPDPSEAPAPIVIVAALPPSAVPDPVPVEAAVPAPGTARRVILPLIGRLAETPGRFRHGIMWMGDSVGSFARRL